MTTWGTDRRLPAVRQNTVLQYSYALIVFGIPKNNSGYQPGASIKAHLFLITVEVPPELLHLWLLGDAFGGVADAKRYSNKLKKGLRWA